MGPKVSCPFLIAESLVTELEKQVDLIICEIHAETTSEKESIGWYLDGRVSLVFGTHTCSYRRWKNIAKRYSLSDGFRYDRT